MGLSAGLHGLAAALFLVTVGATPEQVHVAIAGDSDSVGMAVSFYTAEPCTSPVVTYSASGSEDQATSTVAATSVQYLEGSGYHHHAVIEGLDYDSAYDYALGDSTDGGCGWLSEGNLTFTTPPSSASRSLDFAVFGDLGSRGNGKGDATMDYLRKQVDEDAIKLVWHAGDVSYADDSFLHKDCVFKFCYETVFNGFMNEMQEAGMAQVPWMVTPGNHEADCHDPACLTSKTYRNSLSNFSAYNARFRMPSEETGGVLNMHYSFNAGPAHFLSLDLETGFPGAAEENRYVLKCGGFGDQISWIEADLAAANKSRAERPWIFVAGHHPMYQNGTVNEAMADAIEDLLYQYRVDAMFTGHVHSYERDYPVYQGQLETTSYVNPSATVHILVGGAGNDEMRNDQRRRELRKDFGVADPSPSEADNQAAYEAVDGADWTAITDEGYFGIGMVHIHNDTHMHFEYVRTTEQEVYDEIWLVKEH